MKTRKLMEEPLREDDMSLYNPKELEEELEEDEIEDWEEGFMVGYGES